MKNEMKAGLVQLGVICAGLLVAADSRADLTTNVTMTLANATTYAENSGAFTANLNVTAGPDAGNYGQIINSADLIGIYSFTINSISPPDSVTINTSEPFYSTCVSPAGVLDWNTHTYTLDPFQTANPGMNPKAWAYSGTDYWGIQNANYLFQTRAGLIDSGSGVGGAQAGTSLQDQGAALALAMYAALYNSTGYGLLGNSYFTLSDLQTGDADAYKDYTNDLAWLGGFKPSDPSTLPAGYILRPDNTPGAGQDMVLLGAAVPQSFAVPEPATVLAGMLLILPFGASAFRIIRNRKIRAV